MAWIGHDSSSVALPSELWTKWRCVCMFLSDCMTVMLDRASTTSFLARSSELFRHVLIYSLLGLWTFLMSSAGLDLMDLVIIHLWFGSQEVFNWRPHPNPSVEMKRPNLMRQYLLNTIPHLLKHYSSVLAKVSFRFPSSHRMMFLFPLSVISQAPHPPP